MLKVNALHFKRRINLRARMTTGKKTYVAWDDNEISSFSMKIMQAGH